MSLSVEGIVLALLGSWLFAQCLGLLVYAFGLSPTLAPVVRQRRLGWVAASVVLAPLVVVTGMAILSVLPSPEWIEAHCGGHSHDHLHTCGNAAGSGGLMFGSLLAAAGLAVLWRIFKVLRREYGMRRKIDALHGLSSTDSRLCRLDSQRPLALAKSHGGAAVMISSGLCQALSRRQLRMVVAHEVAHLRHGDGKRSLVFNLALSFCLPALARFLQQAWQIALEEAADDKVRRRFGGPELADTLLRVLSLDPQHLPGSQGISARASAQRIRRLLVPAPSLRGWGTFDWVYPFLMLVLSTVSLSGHHAAETLLHRLAEL